MSNDRYDMSMDAWRVENDLDSGKRDESNYSPLEDLLSPITSPTELDKQLREVGLQAFWDNADSVKRAATDVAHKVSRTKRFDAYIDRLPEDVPVAVAEKLFVLEETVKALITRDFLHSKQIDKLTQMTKQDSNISGGGEKPDEDKQKAE